MKKIMVSIVMILMTAAGIFMGNIHLAQAAQSVSNDYNMKTEKYDVNVTIGNDGSYTVTEKIKVRFLNPRHGIYRYIPNKGNITVFDNDGKEQKFVYHAKVKMKDSNVEYECSFENGNVVYRFGDEDTYVNRQTYEFTYQFIPEYQDKSFQKIYYNVFPTQWKNQIPAGSSFQIQFPQKTDISSLKFYYGQYGTAQAAENILRMKKNEDQNVLFGTVTKNLSLGEGITLYGEMGDGYFSETHQPGLYKGVLAVTLAVLILTAGLFIKAGKDEKIIPSIQYQPPEGLDSAAVGYIIDGSLEDKDMISLILYWADRGYLRIEEKKKGSVILYKLCKIPKDAPNYQKYLFDSLFKNKDYVKVSSLKHKFVDHLIVAKDKLKFYYKGKIYTTASKIARIITLIAAIFPFGSFLIMMTYYHYLGMAGIILEVILWLLFAAGCVLSCCTVDKWYAVSSGKRKALLIGSVFLAGGSILGYGAYYMWKVQNGKMFKFLWVYVVVAATSLAVLGFTAFMKKRTDQCVQWMGYLAGLRDFIETAELDRMKVLAKDYPEMFYHILPYASVFGLSDIFAKKLDDLKIPAPEWYTSYVDTPYFHYYMLSSCMEDTVQKTLSVPEPPKSGGSGGFSGGSFGGGFSGGGFGGGGGGSW